MIVLLDEVRSPTLRETLSVLLTRASHADFAVAELRLSGLDLSVLGQKPDQRFRVLVRHFNSEFAYDATTAAPGSAVRNRIVRLRELAMSGRVEVRAARLDVWTPDFSILRDVDPHCGPVSSGNAVSDVLLLGAHYFDRPFPLSGAALTSATTSAQAVRRAARRFEELWQRADDIVPVIIEILEHALNDGLADHVTADRGTAHP